MAVAIAINIAVGSIVYALRLPIYLDSIGTVLVGALAGPWAGALTGILSNLIWSILPIPGGAKPDGRVLRPGRRRDRPDGRLLGQPRRLPVPLRRRAGGGFLALATGFGAAVAFLLVQSTIGIPTWRPPTKTRSSPTSAFVLMALAFVGGRRGRRLVHRPDRLRLQGGRPEDQAVSARCHRGRRLRARRRDRSAAVRPDRLLLVGGRRPRRRHGPPASSGART